MVPPDTSPHVVCVVCEEGVAKEVVVVFEAPTYRAFLKSVEHGDGLETIGLLGVGIVWGDRGRVEGEATAAALVVSVCPVEQCMPAVDPSARD